MDEKIKKSGPPQSEATAAGSANSTIGSGNAQPSVMAPGVGHTMSAARPARPATRKRAVDQKGMHPKNSGEYPGGEG